MLQKKRKKKKTLIRVIIREKDKIITDLRKPYTTKNKSRNNGLIAEKTQSE